MRFDPRAGLGWWEISIQLADRTWTIPPVPAADWIDAITTGGWSAIVPGMIAEDTGELEDSMLMGDIDESEILTVAREALESATGVRWWIAQRLIHGIADWEHLGGEMLSRGVRFDTEPLSVVLIIAWRTISRNLDENKLAELTMKLEMPPTDSGIDLEEMDNEEANADAFAQLAQRTR